MSAQSNRAWPLTLGIILIVFGTLDFMRQGCCVLPAFHQPPLHIGLDAPAGWDHLKTVVNAHRTGIICILVSGIIISMAMGFAGLVVLLRESWGWVAAIITTGLEFSHGFAVLALNRLKLNAQFEGIRMEQLPSQAGDFANIMGQLGIMGSIGWNIILPLALFGALILGRRFIVPTASPTQTRVIRQSADSP